MEVKQKNPKVLSMDRRFGTDGIRGPIDSTMNPLFVTKLGWAAGKVFLSENIDRILIGKDTRISGYMLESALQAGLISAGMNVTLLGPLPTPAVAHLAKSQNKMGVVISASHNSFEDNGIKFFSNDGYKISSKLEKKIEILLTQEIQVVEASTLGKTDRLNDAQGRYIEFCKSSVPDLDLTGLRICLDCANGSAYSVGPKIFEELGAEVFAIAVEPDGTNINKNCGSTDPKVLIESTNQNNCDLGMAFDGDGDRINVVDRSGNILDGDDLLYILALSKIINNKTSKPSKGVVGTLMTNSALENIFKKNNIDFIRSDVGDKFVLEEMLNKGWLLGGEPSGHIICLESSTTGDACIASLQILLALQNLNMTLEESLSSFKKYPQKLINLKVTNPHKVIMNQKLRATVSDLEKRLKNEGRILLRPSGTEPLIRIMVEANTPELTNDSADRLAEVIKNIA
ncbi:MAG: phosphoglucosamine mutase [SAR86 cluster bacterium]|jgi:phosphoglucosamine mutase|nr:phosphoglucosamine mutase [SAR86 cluster bacterium]